MTRSDDHRLDGYYQAMRRALLNYLKAVQQYREVRAEYLAKFPTSPAIAKIRARSDFRFISAVGDQEFYAREVQVYGTAWQVERQAQRDNAAVGGVGGVAHR